MKKIQDKKSIITITPKIRQKGFKSENITINDRSMENKEVLSLLEASYQENNIENLFNENDIKIIKLVIESYKIKISDNELLKEHFILDGPVGKVVLGSGFWHVPQLQPRWSMDLVTR